MQEARRLYLGPTPRKQIEVRSSRLARVTSKHDHRFHMAKFLVGAALEEFINPSMYIDSTSLVVVFCIGFQCVFICNSDDFNPLISKCINCFPGMFDDLQSFPAYVSLNSNQVVPKILVLSIVFAMCFN